MLNYHIGSWDQFPLALCNSPVHDIRLVVLLSGPRSIISFSPIFHLPRPLLQLSLLRFVFARCVSLTFSIKIIPPFSTSLSLSLVSSGYCRPPASIMHLKRRRLKDRRLSLASSGILQYKLDSWMGILDRAGRNEAYLRARAEEELTYVFIYLCARILEYIFRHPPTFNFSAFFVIGLSYRFLPLWSFPMWDYFSVSRILMTLIF